MVELKKVTSDNIYETIHGFITTGEVVVEEYDSMIEVILSMIKGGYCFAMDRDILRDAMESLTYMYAPSDDMNKDRLVQQFADDDDASDEEEEEEDFGNMDLMKMMQMMGGAMGTDAAPAPSSDATPTEECKMVTTDEVPIESSDTTIVKDDSAPVAEEPITDEPVTEAPVAEAPVAEAPVAEAPVAEAPVATEETGGAE
jgi:hypothetical protein